MQLSVRDVCKLFEVTEDQVYRWVRERAIPYYRVNHEHRFNREEILEWATTRGIRISPELFAQPLHDGESTVRLSEALREGGVHPNLASGDLSSVLGAVVGALPLPARIDRELLLESLLAREAMGSTGVGEGIAIPHVRNPVVLHVPKPMVALGYLADPVEFGAVDGQPVHTLFTIVTPNARVHLHLLAKLSAALHDAAFRAAVLRRADLDTIVTEARRVDDAARPLRLSDRP